MNTEIQKIAVTVDVTLHHVIERMNENRFGIVLVLDGARKLIGTVTDGDIRRALLSQIPLNESVATLLESKKKTRYSKPVTAQIGASREEYLVLLKEHQLLHLPILDAQGCVVGLVTQVDFAKMPGNSVQAVIMAGGKGERLMPLTSDLPKPMLHVGDKPLLEIIVNQLKKSGIGQVYVTTHHHHEAIKQHFGDGSGFGVDLQYVSEDRPLGTAGAVALVKHSKETLLVMNGDVLTKVNFNSMLDFHREHRADLSVAVRSYAFDVPYGVIECDDLTVTGVREKPRYNFLVNAGIYLVESAMLKYIPKNITFHMTDLITRLLEEEKRVISFPVHESWLDIGNHQEYQRAQEAIKEYS